MNRKKSLLCSGGAVAVFLQSAIAFEVLNEEGSRGHRTNQVLTTAAQGGSARSGDTLTAVVPDEAPPVKPIDLQQISPSEFSDEELGHGPDDRPLPYYLAHITAVANSVAAAGPEQGWISQHVWRDAKAVRIRDPRVMENVLSLAWFYTRNRPWNPYFGDPALRRRLEEALRYYVDCIDENGFVRSPVPGYHVGQQLSTTMFFTKFMGETIQILHDGPFINPDLYASMLEAQRRALLYCLRSDLAFFQGRRFSNQYGNVVAGAYAYLNVVSDEEISQLLDSVIIHKLPAMQSPAGFMYENHSADFGYSLHTYHSNIHMAWHYAVSAGRDISWMKKEVGLWAEWLAYNAVPEPDESYFYLNRAIETRQDKPGFSAVKAPFARDVPALRAFVATAQEVTRHQDESRRRVVADWPDVDPLGKGFHAFSPYDFLHRSHFSWYPDRSQREDSIKALPCFSSRPFTHQRVDDRRKLEVTCIRRPGYYALFNAGEQQAESQTFGLGLLWHPATGAILQSQSGNPAGAWGVQFKEDSQPVESRSLAVSYRLDDQEFSPGVGCREYPGNLLSITYRLPDRGDKSVYFEDHRILVVVDSTKGGIVEQIPLLIPEGSLPWIDKGVLRVDYGSAELMIRTEGAEDLKWSETGKRIGPKRLVMAELRSNRRLVYSFYINP